MSSSYFRTHAPEVFTNRTAKIDTIQHAIGDLIATHGMIGRYQTLVIPPIGLETGHKVALLPLDPWNLSDIKAEALRDVPRAQWINLVGKAILAGYPTTSSHDYEDMWSLNIYTSDGTPRELIGFDGQPVPNRELPDVLNDITEYHTTLSTMIPSRAS